MDPGFRLRQIRERLGLTYRDVQRDSQLLASRRGDRQFVLHISRLAEIENRQVVPSLHKLYTLAAIYRLNPMEIFGWYGIPVNQLFSDAIGLSLPNTHLMRTPAMPSIRGHSCPQNVPEQTGFLNPASAETKELGNVLRIENARGCYGCIGTRDYRMAPMLRPGSVVVIDTSVRRIEETEWRTEFERPIYFIELHDGHRCGWFAQEGSLLIMHTHPLSRCTPEWWKVPDEAEIVGRVTAVVSRLREPVRIPSRQSPEWLEHSSKTVR